MGKVARTLTSREVQCLTKTTAVGGVSGLTLRIRSDAEKTWVLIKMLGGKRRSWKVGNFPKMTLSEARKKAAEMLSAIEAGEDPVEKEKPAPATTEVTVEQLLRMFIRAEDARGRWSTRGRQTHAEKADGWIRNHMSSKLKAMRVRDLTPAALADEFGELMLSMRSTPEKCIGEIKRAIDWGMALGHIPPMANPADVKGALGHLLPTAKNRPKKTHMPYLPPDKIPDFVAVLSQKSGCASRTLLFAMLTASRISNCLQLRWEQVDLDKMLIRIPREEMKVKGLSFDRVTPLSAQAVSILKGMPRFSTTGETPDWVFRDFVRAKDPLSEATLRALIRRLSSEHKDHEFFDPVEVDSAGRHRLPVPHGLARASFETWAKNPTAYGHELFDPDFIDACLDHFSPKYGGAYMRAYPLEDMRKILDAWADFCFSKINECAS